MKIVEQVFKTNDIRGEYPDEIDEKFAYLLGQAIGEIIGAENVVIGRDSRLSSPSLSASLAAGVEQAGGKIASLGICPAELTYYAVTAEKHFDHAVMVTASHNPPRDNGFKIVDENALPVTCESGLKDVKKWMAQATPPQICPVAREADYSLRKEYVDFAVEIAGIPETKGMKIAIDPANGTGGILWDRLSEATGIRPLRLNFEPDGRFPSHAPNPAKRKNLKLLKDKVNSENANLGLAYDGDADRTVAVTDDGKIVDGSGMIALLIEYLFGKDKNACCAVSMTTSRNVLEWMRNRGMEPAIVPVGHAKVKRIMNDRADIDFAGEESGHYFYRSLSNCESSILTSLNLFHLLARRRLKPVLRELAAKWKRPVSEPEFPFDERKKSTEVCRSAAERFLHGAPEPLEIMCEHNGEIIRNCTTADIRDSNGVRVDFEDWWFAVRPSGTEPLVRLTGEAYSHEAIAGKLAPLKKWLQVNK
ncbi:MAG: hypothetical protein KGZ25_11645 [Planctomycetes bacterium]|nr:hypothetical protein [Planctomycetota bacterium]